MNDIQTLPIAIVGAGPNGLSLAAHLNARGAEYRIFGEPMSTWAKHMPNGMELKSDGFATSLYAPGRTFTYEEYCKNCAIPYDAFEVRIKVKDFVEYGREFQKRFAPDLDPRTVTHIERDGDGQFRLSFEDGAEQRAKNVALAVGITHFANMPIALQGLSADLVSHSSKHHDLERFRGKKVAVIGAGSSATDIAGLLHEAGAETHLIVRGGGVPFAEKMRVPRPLYDALRWPTSRVGPSWRGFLFDHFPSLFRFLPVAKRASIVKNFLGPGGCYFMRDRVIGRVHIHLGLHPVSAKAIGAGVALTLANTHGEERDFNADHVICATGYKADVSRLPFLSDNLKREVAQHEGWPLLSPTFKSSVPGLYFTGLSAALTFGPVVRFACGADFTSNRLGKHLGERARSRASVNRTLSDKVSAGKRQCPRRASANHGKMKPRPKTVRMAQMRALPDPEQSGRAQFSVRWPPIDIAAAEYARRALIERPTSAFVWTPTESEPPLAAPRR